MKVEQKERTLPRQSSTVPYSTFEMMCPYLVLAAVIMAVAAPGVPRLFGMGQGDDEGCGGNVTAARAGSITTWVTRFNQFLPGGAQPIPLTDGRVYHLADLYPLVDAGYCAEADLRSRVDVTKGWVWNDTTRRFTPEQ